jgi:hypothetical protein
MELQINRDMLWLGILSLYLPLVLLIFRDGIETYNIADAEKRTAHLENVIKLFTLWLSGFVLILVVKNFF